MASATKKTTLTVVSKASFTPLTNVRLPSLLTLGRLTLNSFQKGGENAITSTTLMTSRPAVPLSTGWYNKGRQCHNHITINANGRSVNAMVVDECDSNAGCDKEHDYRPPRANNIVDATKAGDKALPGQCNQENDSDCCVQGKLYTSYICSPSVSSNTKATLTLNSFQKEGDGGGPSECDNQYHSDDTLVMALSTG
ncbi:hypothetical protein LguiA_010372 [Lonicera macranthoides]